MTNRNPVVVASGRLAELPSGDTLVISTADINGGTIDTTVIGGTTPAEGSFTALSASSYCVVGGATEYAVVYDYSFEITAGGNIQYTNYLSASTMRFEAGVAGSVTSFVFDVADANFTGNITVDGNLTVSGTTVTVNTSVMSVEDPLIKLANGNNASDSVDIGFYGLCDPTGSQDTYAGLFRDATDAKFKLFHLLQSEPTTTVNTAGTGYAVPTLVANIEGHVTGGAYTGSVISGQYGGTGVANTGKTITLGNHLTTTGGYQIIFTTTATTNITLPFTGTLATLAEAEVLTNKTLSVGCSYSGTVISGQYGGTGVANAGKTITVAGNTTIGSSTHTVTLTTSANSNVRLPVAGSLAREFIRTNWPGKGITGAAFTAATLTSAGTTGGNEVVDVWDGSGTVSRGIDLVCTMPLTYNGGGLTFNILWSSTAANSTDLTWGVAIRALQNSGGNPPANNDINSGTFAYAYATGSTAAPGYINRLRTTTLSIANGSLQGLAAGDMFILRVVRFAATDANNDASSLWQVTGYET